MKSVVDHIGATIGAQQTNATNTSVIESISGMELIDSALALGGATHHLRESQIQSSCAFSEMLQIDRYKVLQILVNLVRNSIQAMSLADPIPARLEVSAELVDPKHFLVLVRDNGVGIEADNQVKIFSHGFTTRDAGHGFGLHASANAASELGGSSKVQSDGIGRGARFSLVLPIVMT